MGAFKYYIGTLVGVGGVRENADLADQLRWGGHVKNTDVIFEWELYEKYASIS